MDVEPYNGKMHKKQCIDALFFVHFCFEAPDSNRMRMFKIEAGENFNLRNTLSISMIVIWARRRNSSAVCGWVKNGTF